MNINNNDADERRTKIRLKTEFVGFKKFDISLIKNNSGVQDGNKSPMGLGDNLQR
jgi:hypothetical protein